MASSQHCFGDACLGEGYCTCGCAPCAKAPRQDYTKPNRGGRLAEAMRKKAKKLKGLCDAE